MHEVDAALRLGHKDRHVAQTSPAQAFSLTFLHQSAGDRGRSLMERATCFYQEDEGSIPSARANTR